MYQFKYRIGMFSAALLAGAAALTITSCTRTTSAAGAPPPPEVEVAVVEQKDLPVQREWIGTLDGLVNAAIKAEVNGYLLSQNYAEGSFVHKGQTLFQIDARPFQAALDQAQGQLAQAKAQFNQARAAWAQAQAQLASAEANQRKAQLDEDRYVPLAQQQAITQQDLDNAKQTNSSMKAQVNAAKAQVETAKAQIEAADAGIAAAAGAVETAKVNLGFTKLSSPIDGIAGAATTQVGNLVGPASNAVTAVSTLDPIKANFTVSEQEYLSLTRNDALHKLQLELVSRRRNGTSPKRAILICRSPGEPEHRRDSVDGTVSQSRATGCDLASTPKFVPTSGCGWALCLVPQRSVTDTQGNYLVAVVNPNNTIRFTPVKSATASARSGWLRGT
jgi:multidrug efflux pump subunit AcrA (membrane-fusion protein)